MFDEKCLEVNFDDFDKIVTREIIATKSSPEGEFDFDDEDALSVDMGEIGPAEPIDSYEPTDAASEEEKGPETDEEAIEETEDIVESSDTIDTLCGGNTGTSILEMYNKRNKKKNKIVESLLVDNTVDTIEQIVKSSLAATGISKAEATVVLGLILDRLLHASDNDVVAPDFLDSTFGELIGNKDVAKIVKKAVEDALCGIDNPGLNTLWTNSDSKGEPEVAEVKEVISKAVKDKPEEEE